MSCSYYRWHKSRGGTKVWVAQMSCGTYVGGTNVSGTNVGGTKLASPFYPFANHVRV
jgi:hypothetical protein